MLTVFYFLFLTIYVLYGYTFLFNAAKLRKTSEMCKKTAGFYFYGRIILGVLSSKKRCTGCRDDWWYAL